MKQLTSHASLAAMAMTGILVAPTAMAVPDAPKIWEKCAGIALSGKNDCGTAKPRLRRAGHRQQRGG